MLRQEFEQRTGIYPTSKLYHEIEKKYNEDNSLDKDEFCKRYKENTDALAETIQHAAEWEDQMEERQYRETISEKDKEIENLKKQIEEMKKQIEKLEGWEPTEISEITQDKYESLRSAKTTQEFSEEMAKDWLYAQFGFSQNKTKVFQEIPIYQKNKFGAIRTNGYVKRPPVYNAPDWNYIRFNVADWQYEVVDGRLCQYSD